MKYLIILLPFVGILHAQDSLRTELAAAAAISNSVERLAAYDAVAVKHELAPGTKTSGAKAGKWRIIVDVSPLDDSQTVIGRLSSDNEIRVGYRTDTPTLIVRYKEGKLEAYIAYDAFLGSDDTEVTLRFGKEQPITQRWGISTDHKAIFVSGDAASFVRKISTVDSLIVRVTPYGESPVTSSFSTEGIKDVMAAINEAVKKQK